MVLLPLLLSCAKSNTEPAVVIVVLDGVRVEESLGDGTSSATGEPTSTFLPGVWSELVPQGARATAALNIGVTITAPAHCEILSGQRVALANYPNENEPGIYRPELPSLAEIARRELGLSREQTVVMGNTVLIQSTAHSLWPGGYASGADFLLVQEEGAETPARRDGDVLEAIRTLMDETAPRFILANLHGADRAGHYGEIEEYPARVRSLDADLVALWEAMQSSRDYRDGYLILVADHGRHRQSSQDPPWQEHGDACMGCRHIPLLILGPGVAAGSETDAPVLLSDLAPTIGGIMGFEMPWSDGRLLDEMFTIDLGELPLGAAAVAAAGGAVASEMLRDDAWHRSEIVVDGMVLSSPDAIAAEAPTMAAEGERTWLCFRELIADFSAEDAPWLPRCFVRDGDADWEALPLPHEAVSPFWRPALLGDGEGGLVAGWSDNINGHAGVGGALGPVGMTVSRYVPGKGWQHHQPLSELTFPMWPALHLHNGELTAAIAAAAQGDDARTQRRIFAAAGPLGAPLQPLRAAALDDLSDNGGRDFWRLERPALTVIDSTRWLAAIGYRDQETVLTLSSSTIDGDGSWAGGVVLDLDGAVMPHLQPHWVTADGEPSVLFGALLGDDAALCLAQPPGTHRCTLTGSAHIRDLTTDGDDAYAVVEVDGQWVVERWPVDTIGR
ncbi:MAG: hypothetical protein ACI8S6_002909 [Myxococcota bacterium]|jgi:hypothetical protein